MTTMVEIKIQVTERQLAEMDRMIRNETIHGNQWLKDAVTIYKALLVSRRARYQTPARRQPRSLHPRQTAVAV